MPKLGARTVLVGDAVYSLLAHQPVVEHFLQVFLRLRLGKLVPGVHVLVWLSGPLKHTGLLLRLTGYALHGRMMRMMVPLRRPPRRQQWLLNLRRLQRNIHLLPSIARHAQISRCSRIISSLATPYRIQFPR